MASQASILLAEDDPQYGFLIQLALRQAAILGPVHMVQGPEELIHYMGGTHEFADRDLYPLPSAIVLALRAPHIEDFRALRWLYERPQFNRLLVVVLSGGEYEDQRGIAHDLGVDLYEVKPSNFGDLVRLAEYIRHHLPDHRQHKAAA